MVFIHINYSGDCLRLCRIIQSRLRFYFQTTALRIIRHLSYLAAGIVKHHSAFKIADKPTTKTYFKQGSFSTEDHDLNSFNAILIKVFYALRYDPSKVRWRKRWICLKSNENKNFFPTSPLLYLGCSTQNQVRMNLDPIKFTLEWRREIFNNSNMPRCLLG